MSGDTTLDSSQGNKENHGFKKLNTRGSSMGSKMLTIRNNEGKVCATKTLTKNLTKKVQKKKSAGMKMKSQSKDGVTMHTDTLHTTIDN